MEYVNKLLEVQRNFHYVPNKTFLSEWYYPVGVSIGYLTIVFTLRQFMANKNPLNVKAVSAFHNINLLLISIVCFVGMAYGIIDQLIRNNWSLETLMCDEDAKEVNRGPLFFWIYMFYLSKIYELLDTVFLIFKKSRLRFLHVYHHAATLLLVWWCLHWNIPSQWTACVLNALVHVPMYYYYFLFEIGQTSWWKRYLTQMQITQFITVQAVHISSYYWHFVLAKDHCTSYDNLSNPVASGIIWSYLFLFLHLYYQTYVSGGNKGAAGKAAGSANGVANKPKKA